MPSTRPPLLSPSTVALVVTGGTVGSWLRWQLEQLATGDTRSLLVLAMNLSGAAILGWLTGRGFTNPSPVWFLAGVGFCGGLTTFSSFAFDVAARLDDATVVAPLTLTLGTALLAVVAAALGHRMGSSR